MALWMRKSKTGQKTETEVIETKRRKDEKKAITLKRIDNLRIPQESDIIVKSLGSRNTYHFKTKDVSASGAFVSCADFGSLPFQQQATILDCTVALKHSETAEAVHVQFLAKIARVVEPTDVAQQDSNEPPPQNDSALDQKLIAGRQFPGFGVRIVQMTHDQRYVLENYIARHGTPDGHFGFDGDEKTGFNHDQHAMEQESDQVEQSASSLHEAG